MSCPKKENFLTTDTLWFGIPEYLQTVASSAYTLQTIAKLIETRKKHGYL